MALDHVFSVQEGGNAQVPFSSSKGQLIVVVRILRIQAVKFTAKILRISSKINL
jgi:hypothetical protein